MAALTFVFRKHSGPSPADMVPQTSLTGITYSGLQVTWILCLSRLRSFDFQIIIIIVKIHFFRCEYFVFYQVQTQQSKKMKKEHLLKQQETVVKQWQMLK